MASPNSLALPLSLGVHVLLGAAVVATVGAPPPRVVRPVVPVQLDLAEPVEFESQGAPSTGERLPVPAIVKLQATGIERKAPPGAVVGSEAAAGGESAIVLTAPATEGGAGLRTSARRPIDLGLDGGVFRSTLDSLNRSIPTDSAPLVADAKPTAELREGLRAVLGRVSDWARRHGPREGQTEVSIECSTEGNARVHLQRASSNEGIWGEFIGALGADGTLCNPRLLDGHAQTKLLVRVTLKQVTPGGSPFVGTPGARAEGWVDERIRERTNTLLLTFDVDPSDLGQHKVTRADVELLRELLR